MPYPTDDPTDNLLLLQQLVLAYGNQQVVKGIDLQVPRGELICLLGPSGCGKSTLLRAIAGFEQPVSGSVQLHNQLLADKSVSMPPEQRQIGMVFQDVALFPHLSVAQNIAFGLHRWGSAESEARVEQLLDLIGLQGYGERYPHELSGGQQQRVALARAMAPRPQMLLLDEPFSGLDAQMREELVPMVAQWFRREGITALLVTHDQKEAFAFADRVAVMHKGLIEQLDTAYNIYHEPLTRFVADFIGEGEFLRGKVIADGVIDSPLGELTGYGENLAVGSEVEIFIRPDDVLHDDDSTLQAEIVHGRFRGTHFLYQVQLPDGQEVSCFTDSHHNHEVGEAIGISLNLDHLLVYPLGQ